MKTRLAIALSISGLAVLTLRLQPALACTPPPGGLPRFTVAQHVQAAQIVLEGVVTHTAPINYEVTATVQVVQYLKGSGPARPRWILPALALIWPACPPSTPGTT